MRNSALIHPLHLETAPVEVKLDDLASPAVRWTRASSDASCDNIPNFLPIACHFSTLDSLQYLDYTPAVI
jgi:hypothetical protein